MENASNYNLAAKLAAEKGFISTPMFQRSLNVGYSVAAALIDLLTANGIIADGEGNGKRKYIDNRGGCENTAIKDPITDSMPRPE